LFGEIWIDFGTNFGKAGKVIYPQGDSKRVLVRELPRQTPADADIAKIINYAAKNAPCLHVQACLSVGFNKKGPE
jgi:hypothetical protein